MTFAHTTPPSTARFPDLQGKTAIVTGAARGIGKGIAEVLAGQGMNLALASLEKKAGRELEAAFRATGVDCLYQSANLAKFSEAQRFFNAATRRFGQIHLLVNNAANKLDNMPFLETDPDNYRAMFEDNTRITYGLSWLCARHMAEHQSGAIVSISSVGGLRAHTQMAAYDASKAALESFTRSMALELGPHGIRVNAIGPGAIDDKGMALTPERRKLVRNSTPKIPLRRFGEAHEIGMVAAFLASGAASYVTGQTLYVDGGITVQLFPPDKIDKEWRRQAELQKSAGRTV